MSREAPPALMTHADLHTVVRVSSQTCVLFVYVVRKIVLSVAERLWVEESRGGGPTDETVLVSDRVRTQRVKISINQRLCCCN